MTNQEKIKNALDTITATAFLLDSMKKQEILDNLCQTLCNSCIDSLKGLV